MPPTLPDHARPGRDPGLAWCPSAARRAAGWLRAGIAALGQRIFQVAARRPLMRARRLLLATCVALWPLLAAGWIWGDPPGAACAIKGSGFQSSDACRYRCLSRWQLRCPDGTEVTPNTCSGAFGCKPGSCPQGQLCYADDDPFDDRSFCVAANTCGDLSAAAQADWERSSVQRQREVIQARLARQARRAAWLASRGGAASAGKAAVAEPVTQPVTQPSTSPEPPPAAVAVPPPGPALPCAATPEREAVLVAPLELRAGQRFERKVGQAWQLVLHPVEHGWHLQLLDRPEAQGAVDLSAVTPPMRGDANPRFLLGWHFRNAGNTGPNDGSVNAAGMMRLFTFDPGLTGTGGYRPAHPPAGAAAPGRGWLRVESLELTPVAALARASIQAVRLGVCLSWPRPSAAQLDRWASALATSRAAQRASHLDYDVHDSTVMAACGMDASRYRLDARVLPRVLQLDLDGDGRPDTAMQAVRASDQARGIVLCRGRGPFEWIGPDHPVIAANRHARTLTAMEAWRAVARDRGGFGYVDEPSWPDMAGDGLVIERQEKSMLMLYRRASAWHALNVVPSPNR